jgi:urease accessory protein
MDTQGTAVRELMRVPLADVGRRGRMSLTFALQGERTILKESYCEVPFKITRLLDSGSETPHIILMHCTAGLFGGDEVECSIRVESGASVRITQQSATRIHPSGGRAAIQRNRIVVESGAHLQFYLEPVIPFADSILSQSTSIDVHGDGCLAYWEGFMTGRVGRGECWQFQKLASETRLSIDGKLAYLDRFDLSPPEQAPSKWAMRDGNYLGTGLYVDPTARRFASRLHEELPHAGIDALSDALLAVRVIAREGPDFHRSQEAFCRQETLPNPRIISRGLHGLRG